MEYWSHGVLECWSIAPLHHSITPSLYPSLPCLRFLAKSGIVNFGLCSYSPAHDVFDKTGTKRAVCCPVTAVGGVGGQSLSRLPSARSVQSAEEFQIACKHRVSRKPSNKSWPKTPATIATPMCSSARRSITRKS